MGKYLEKAQKRLKVRQAGVEVRPGIHMPGSMNRNKSASIKGVK